MSELLRMEHISKRFGSFYANKDISLTVNRGEVLTLLGENGAGKSTTMKLILDLIRRDGGSITILGHDNRSGLKTIKEHIGVVMDEACFPECLTAKEISRILKNIYRTYDEGRFFSYLSRYRLPVEKKVKEYSRGMKMKLSIAAALSHESQLLILDEATSGLDPVVREELLDTFLEFIQDERHSVLISSHIMSDLEKISDYITFIHRGRILFSEEKDLLKARYGILKCGKDTLSKIDPAVIEGRRENQFGVEALVRRDRLRSGYAIDPAGLEDIMLFLVKHSGR